MKIIKVALTPVNNQHFEWFKTSNSLIEYITTKQIPDEIFLESFNESYQFISWYIDSKYFIEKIMFGDKFDTNYQNLVIDRQKFINSFNHVKPKDFCYTFSLSTSVADNEQFIYKKSKDRNSKYVLVDKSQKIIPYKIPVLTRLQFNRLFKDNKLIPSDTFCTENDLSKKQITDRYLKKKIYLVFYNHKTYVLNDDNVISNITNEENNVNLHKNLNELHSTKQNEDKLDTLIILVKYLIKKVEEMEIHVKPTNN